MEVCTFCSKLNFMRETRHTYFLPPNLIEIFNEIYIYVFIACCPSYSTEYNFSRIRSDLADIEISKFVSGIAGSKSTASRNNPRRCYRTSMSSGYSSHSPPLSAGSYSYYASTSTRDPSYGSLAVIHESEAIPRPIWPSVIYHHTEDHSAGGYEGNKRN